ncbi:hypothetical protein PHABIO_244 [Pseudomonas phage Phabio]|uniref:Uncharacterized protein n=1 Tax=Pseudomonas phage Phabio TaxID=2006668 RepID=A0A1Y0SWK6_9CAUD|nr:hypothetical protein MZD05_gp244 [Pseudomonas phage Phabio]ARV76875.1 hypothetical protein PHABIO_244 [Pseudomonas phage Phabio]
MDKPVAVFIPVEPDIDYATLDYDQQIQHTQRIKARILHKLSTSQVDGGVPTDKDSVELLLKVADSMDRTTLTNKRNAVEEQNGGSNADILKALTLVAIQNGNSNPLMSKEPVVSRNTHEEIPIEALGEFTHNEGIGFIGVENETVDAFNKRMDPIAEAARRAEEEELGIT